MSKINNYGWLECIPNGWVHLGNQMIEECEAAEPNFEIVDLKEKWGEIRLCGYPHTEKILEIEDKYAKISQHTCCQCGKPATKVSLGWICPWCDECGTNEEKYYKRFE